MVNYHAINSVRGTLLLRILKLEETSQEAFILKFLAIALRAAAMMVKEYCKLAPAHHGFRATP